MKKYVKPEMVCRSTKLNNYIINCSRCECTVHQSHSTCEAHRGDCQFPATGGETKSLNIWGDEDTNSNSLF